MQVLEIRVSELESFVQSDLWKRVEPKPITGLRAISQARNPRAQPDDVALIIAFGENVLLGLAGLLPDWSGAVQQLKTYSNSCWWAHPEKGRHLAVPLFLKALSRANQRMFLTDCTPHTYKILQQTGLFFFPETPAGLKGFLRIRPGELLPARFPGARKLLPLLKIADSALALIFFPYLKLNQGLYAKKAPETVCKQSIDPEMEVFISQHSSREFTRRTAADLRWIMQYPWICEKTGSDFQEQLQYPFSHLVGQFSQYWLNVYVSGKLAGLLFFSLRDGHMKIPYVYFDDQFAGKIVDAVYFQALKEKVVSLTVFNPRLVAAMKLQSKPFIFSKETKKLTAISKALAGEYENCPEFQDGDGDVVFT